MEKLFVRDACRRRMPLNGSDAQALEGALQQAEREIAEKDKEIERLTLEKVQDNTLINELREAIESAETQTGFLLSAIMADDPMVQLLFRAKDLHNVLVKALGKEE